MTHHMRGICADARLHTADIEIIRAWNANYIRYMMGGSEVEMSSVEAYYTWLHQYLDYLDEILRLCQHASKPIRIVLNLATLPGGTTITNGSRAYTIFVNKGWLGVWLDTWREIARRYKNDKRIYGFDVVGEPAVRKDTPGKIIGWLDAARLVTRAVHSEDPHRVVIIESIYGGPLRIKGLTPLALELKDRPVEYSVHVYSPMDFTHQGIYSQYSKVKSWPDAEHGRTKAKLREQFQNTLRFRDVTKKNVIVGEFSAVRWAPGDSAANYLHDSTQLMEEYSLDWLYYQYAEYRAFPGHPFFNGWSLEHGGDKANNAVSPVETSRLKLMKRMWAKNTF